MPISGISTISDGPMSWASIASNWEAVRTYLNAGILVGDVATGSIMREHLARPVIGAFPSQGFEGHFQGYFPTAYGEWTPYALGTEWGFVPERLTLCPDSSNLDAERVWRTALGRTFYHIGGEFRASLTANMLVRTDPAVHSYVSETDGAGTTEKLGYLELRTYNRQNRVETVQTESRRDVYGTNAAGVPPVDNLTMWAISAMDPGIYDCYLVYRHGGQPDAHVIQIDLTSILFLPEIF